MKSLSCGFALPKVDVNWDSLIQNEIQTMGFDFSLVHLTRPNSKDLTTKSLTVLDQNLDLSQVCVEIDSSNSHDWKEWEYAIHMGFPVIMIKLEDNLMQLASIVKLKVTGCRSMICVKVPATEESWSRWNKFRHLLGLNSPICIALQISKETENLNRWLSEPIKCIFVESRDFSSESTLPFNLQNICIQAIKYRLRIFIQSNLDDWEDDFSSYYSHLDEIYLTMPRMSQAQLSVAEFNDVLQIPLQPLMDNLESSTYQVFEQDLPKYDHYERAIEMAISDKKLDETLIMVVGAGRGPLIRCCLRAAKSFKVKIVAIEKNFNAFITLSLLLDTEWKDKNISLVHCDMRSFNPSEKCDILVSELLGSIGDNELSPECLFAAQSFLKADGISIPSSYKSFFAPVSCSKIYSKVAPLTTTQYESPYVVQMNEHVLISEPKSFWTFEHPTNKFELERFTCSTFVSTNPALLCHGLAGYFEAILYKNVSLSIVPQTHTKDMLSWFPMFFPLKVPFTVHPGQILEVAVWRKCQHRKVWYEWSISMGDLCSEIHNTGGHAYWIGQ